MLLALYLIYCMLWILTILLVSSLVNQSRHALTILICLWFVLTILTPRLLADFAAQQYPQLSRNAFDRDIKNQVSKIGDSHNPNDPHFNEFKAKTLEEYGVASVEELPVNYRALVIQEGERISSKIFSDMYSKQLSQQQKQHQLISRFYWINPYLLIRDLSMAIAGTDSWHFYDYEIQSEHHRYARIEKLNKIHAEHIDAAHDRGSKADSSHWQQFQAFEYQMPTISQSLAPYRFIWQVPLMFILLGVFFATNGNIKRRVYALA